MCELLKFCVYNIPAAAHSLQGYEANSLLIYLQSGLKSCILQLFKTLRVLGFGFEFTPIFKFSLHCRRVAEGIGMPTYEGSMDI